MALSPLIWLAIGLVCIGIEIIVPGFVVFWLGVGGVLTSLGVFAGIIPRESAEVQWAFFFLSSLSFLLLWHFYFKRFFKKDVVDDHRDPTISELRGRVVKAVLPDIPGEVDLYNYYHGIKRWQAEADEAIDEGEEVSVIEARGIRLYIQRKK
jgi:membrane protein implicated in regulation of membrane protease activity